MINIVSHCPNWSQTNKLCTSCSVCISFRWFSNYLNTCLNHLGINLTLYIPFYNLISDRDFESVFQIIPGLCMYIVPLPVSHTFLWGTLRRIDTVSNWRCCFWFKTETCIDNKIFVKLIIFCYESVVKRLIQYVNDDVILVCAVGENNKINLTPEQNQTQILDTKKHTKLYFYKKVTLTTSCTWYIHDHNYKQRVRPRNQCTLFDYDCPFLYTVKYASRHTNKMSLCLPANVNVNVFGYSRKLDQSSSKLNAIDGYD